MENTANATKSTYTKADFNQIYKEHHQQVMNVIRMKTRNSEEMMEILDDTFMQVLKHLEDYDISKSKLSTWIIFIANNKVIDYYRKETSKAQRFVNVDNFAHKDSEEYDTSNFFVGHEDTDQPIKDKELSASIEKAMATLKPNYRCVAELYLRQDRSYNEIAEILDIPLNTVKVTLMRAKEMLQGELSKLAMFA